MQVKVIDFVNNEVVFILNHLKNFYEHVMNLQQKQVGY